MEIMSSKGFGFTGHILCASRDTVGPGPSSRLIYKLQVPRAAASPVLKSEARQLRGELSRCLCPVLT